MIYACLTGSEFVLCSAHFSNAYQLELSRRSEKSFDSAVALRQFKRKSTESYFRAL